MKKIKKITGTAIVAVLLAAMAGCDKNFLERMPLTEISEPNVWSDPDLTRAFVARLYGQMDHGNATTLLAVFTDEAVHNHGWSTQHLVQGTLTPDNTSPFGTCCGHTEGNNMRWQHLYPLIRDANMFLEKIGQVPFANAADRDQITGEVYLLRAWSYFSLLRFYGGVPKIDRVYGLGEADVLRQMKRSSFAEIVDFILADITRAIPLLGEQADLPRGMFHKSAAKALKSRLLLHAASDLYNRPGNTNELIGYVNASAADRTARWTAARDAAKDIIDDGKHSLYAPGGSPQENYANIFLDKGNQEVIFRKVFDRDLNLSTDIDMHNAPNGYEGWGTNQPTQNFVDLYQMADGTAFDWNNAAHAASPYQNRDPRFYATVLYNGAPWKPRGPAAIALDPIGIIQTGRNQYWTGAKLDTLYGLDTKRGPIHDWNGTRTGYYLRKFMDITNLDPENLHSGQDYVHFRYAEILLNHAEACIELGEEAAARTSLKLVRERAGMPGSDVDAASGIALRNLYRYERRVELAFEGHRFFDARRWMTAGADFGQNALGIDVFGKLQVPNDNSSLKHTYSMINAQDRDFPDKMYFMPIPAGEIRANGNLVQNPGY